MRFNLMTALVLVVIGLAYQVGYSQITGREPPCGCYCGYPGYESFNIVYPCTGRLQEDACEDGMRKMPDEQFRSVCRLMQARLRSKPDGNACKKLFAKICPAFCKDISCYCGGSPTGGSAFAQSADSGTIKIYEEPTHTSVATSYAVNGERLRYIMVMQIDGLEWFKIKRYGVTGWVSSKDLSCGRPGKDVPLNVGLYTPSVRITAAQVAGGRG